MTLDDVADYFRPKDFRVLVHQDRFGCWHAYLRKAGKTADFDADFSMKSADEALRKLVSRYVDPAKITTTNRLRALEEALDGLTLAYR